MTGDLTHMTHRVFWTLALATACLFSLGTLFAAPAKEKVPPFRVTAKKCVAELLREPRKLHYTGNVKFVTPVNRLVLTCQRLDAVLKSGNEDIARMEATGSVVFTMESEGTDKEKTVTKVTGTAESMVYETVGEVHVLRMMKVGDTLPKLSMVNAKTGERISGDLTGNEIRYTLETGVLEADDVTTENKGAAQ